jgi:hypothetical protein
MDDFPWMSRQDHNGVNISCQTRLLTTEKILCDSIKQVSLVSSAGVNTVVFSRFDRPGVDVMITIFCDFSQFTAKNWRFS